MLGRAGRARCGGLPVVVAQELTSQFTAFMPGIRDGGPCRGITGSSHRVRGRLPGLGCKQSEAGSAHAVSLTCVATEPTKSWVCRCDRASSNPAGVLV